MILKLVGFYSILKFTRFLINTLPPLPKYLQTTCMIHSTDHDWHYIFLPAIVKLSTPFSDGLATNLAIRQEDTANFPATIKIGTVPPSCVLHCNLSHTFLTLEIGLVVRTWGMGRRHVTSHLQTSDRLLHRSREDIYETSLCFVSGIDSCLRAASCATVELDVTEQTALAFNSACVDKYSFYGI
jgi:hypothetical protein